MAFDTVDEAFGGLLRRIELNPSRVALASQRYNAVKATIESALPGKAVHQVGSFQRKTKIRPTDLSDRLDVDVLVSFGRFFAYAATGQGVSPANALQIVRSALSSSETYKVMPQRQDHPVVRLEYADEMAIELIPAFEDHTGQHPHGIGDPACYIVGASPGSWQVADYDYDAQTISRLNGIAKEMLVPTIKLVKAYFRSRGVPLKSFHTEVLVANVVPNVIREWEGKGYRYGYQHILAAFLSRASITVTGAVRLPGSYSPPLDSDLGQYTLGDVAAFFAKRAEVAWQLCGNKVAGNPVNHWRDFFGEPFPS